MSRGRPSHADASHIARRRVPSAPAHEVDLDEVELFDEAPASSVPPPPSARRPTSLAPLPIESPPSHAPFNVPIAAEVVRPRGRVPMILACAGIALAIGAAAGVVFRPRDVYFERTPYADTPPATVELTPPPPVVAPRVGMNAAVAASAAPVVSAPPALSALPISPLPPISGPSSPASSVKSGEIPVVQLAALPRPSSGTVIGAEGHRLWIDGALAASWQASVSCGKHVVQVGSAGASRTVDVPCGEQVTVLP